MSNLKTRCLGCNVEIDMLDYYNERGLCMQCYHHEMLLEDLCGHEPKYYDNNNYEEEDE